MTKYKLARSRMPSQNHLERMYRKFNKLFFYGHCPTRVSVSTALKPLPVFRDAREGFGCSFIERLSKGSIIARIWINPKFGCWTIAQQTLLHEMVHLFIELQCDVRAKCTGGSEERCRFDAEIRRIFALGAYDALL